MDVYWMVYIEPGSLWLAIASLVGTAWERYSGLGSAVSRLNALKCRIAICFLPVSA